MRGRHRRSVAQTVPGGAPARTGRPLTWPAVGAVLTLGLRAPWADAALGRDEAGLALISAGWSDGGPHAYGEHFIDRPPLLLAAFRVAEQAAARLVVPLVGSGLGVLLICAVAGIARLRDRPVGAAALAAWLVGGLVGVALGGSYWAHYLIALVPATAVGAAVMFAARPRAGALVISVVVALGAVVAAGAALRGQPARHARDAVTVADYLRDRARPGDSAHVMYAYASVLYYSGLRAPFAYHWSLMMQSAPGAEGELRRLLASPRRPTWLVERHRSWAFGLDRDGVTRRLLETHYRPAGTVRGMAILVARGARGSREMFAATAAGRPRRRR